MKGRCSPLLPRQFYTVPFLSRLNLSISIYNIYHQLRICLQPVPTKILINYLTSPEAREEWVHNKDSLVNFPEWKSPSRFTIVHPSFFPLFLPSQPFTATLSLSIPHIPHFNPSILDHTSSMSYHLGLPYYLIVRPADVTPRGTRTS